MNKALKRFVLLMMRRLHKDIAETFIGPLFCLFSLSLTFADNSIDFEEI